MNHKERHLSDISTDFVAVIVHASVVLYQHCSQLISKVEGLLSALKGVKSSHLNITFPIT
jgi:hypothetical protein